MSNAKDIAVNCITLRNRLKIENLRNNLLLTQYKSLPISQKGVTKGYRNKTSLIDYLKGRT